MNSTSSTSPASAAPRGAASAGKPAVRPWQFFLTASLLGAAAALWVAPPAHPAALLFLSLAVLAAGASAVALHAVLSALAGRVSEPGDAGTSGRDALEREKLLTLRAIKDLEFDKAMGKISDADAAPMEARLRERALALIQQLDGREALRARIEADLAARQAQGSGLSAQDSAGTTGPAPGALGPAPVVCASCATANDPDANFCKSCGGKL